jgi:uncharacterized PurR-regulated membrane protein YhhQ (DUF165 family)
MPYLIAYIATIILANLAITYIGPVPVAPGLMAPAGVFFAGLALTLRDFTQDRLGRWPVVGAIIAGAALSALLSPALALASGVAFLVSEAVDFTVYTPLRERRWLLAIALSNTVGLIVDSVLFLWLAFGSLDFLAGQVVGKFYMTVAAVAVLWMVRRKAGSRALTPEGETNAD